MGHREGRDGTMVGTVSDWTKDEVEQAVAALRDGGLILVKGDVGYGLLGSSEAALRRLYRLKERAGTKPCGIMGTLEVLDAIAGPLDDRLRTWLGEISAKFPCAGILNVRDRSTVLTSLSPWVQEHVVQEGSVAVFLGRGQYIEAIIRRVLDDGLLVIGSSANVSGTGNCFSLRELPPSFLRAVDFYVDHGDARYANPDRVGTTMLDFEAWRVHRRGVNWQEIERSMELLKAELEGK